LRSAAVVAAILAGALSYAFIQVTGNPWGAIAGGFTVSLVFLVFALPRAERRRVRRRRHR